MRKLISALAVVIGLSCLGCGRPAPQVEEVAARPQPIALSPENSSQAKPSEPASSGSGGEEAGEANKPGDDGAGLIPRKTLFDNPDKTSTRLSPDGKHISYLAPDNGVLNVFVASTSDPGQAKSVTRETVRGVPAYFWAFDNAHILYVQDKGGDEDWHLYSVDLASGDIKDLTPIPKVNAQVTGLSEKFPDEILVGINDRDPQYHDVYRVNLKTGERQLAQKNTEFAGFLADDDFRIRIATKMTPDGGSQLYESDGQGGWKEYQKIAFEDTLTTGPAGFDKSGQILYMTDSRGRDTSALVQFELSSGEQKVLAADERSDVGAVLAHPQQKNVQAVSFNYERSTWKVLDPAIEPDLSYLQSVAAGEIQVPSRTLDDKLWIVAYIVDDGPMRYYLYDRDAREARFLFTNRKALEGLPLVKMHPLVIPARDKLQLVSYLSLPKGSDEADTGRPRKPLPMVLLVHGGPWGRDNWGYDTEHQLFANRGYAVLSVNFRGSTGLGKSFTNAGNREWAGKMHDDLLDAVEWAVKEKIADPKRVAIAGGSYGGYAALVGLTFTPDTFACGVDIVGPSNLVTLLSTIPPYWAPQMQLFKDRVGDPETEEGKKLLNERSPLHFAERIKRPLLIGQGANDPRVKQAESDQIVRAMRDKKIPFTYVVFPDEGHGFARPANNLSFYAVAEAFLAKHLGGRYQPIGQDFAGSTITSPEGSENVPGFAEALRAAGTRTPAASSQ